MTGHQYRDLIAEYVLKQFGPDGIAVYTEVSLGKTIIGKDRRIDVFLVRRSDQRALAIEAKYQGTSGTTDEKIPYALQDLEAMWVPGVLAYAGTGWSAGVLHTLEGSHLGVSCLPTFPDLHRTSETRELDHVVASIFGLWERVIPPEKAFVAPRRIGPLEEQAISAQRSERLVPTGTTTRYRKTSG